MQECLNAPFLVPSIKTNRKKFSNKATLPGTFLQETLKIQTVAFIFQHDPLNNYFLCGVVFSI